MNVFGMLWIGVYGIHKHVPGPANIQQLCTAIEEATFHRPQSTT